MSAFTIPDERMQISTIMAIISAKERSARLPGKNLKDLAGKPMLAGWVGAALSAFGGDNE